MMMNAMMMMPSSSCSPEEREKRKKVKHQIASFKKRQKHTEDMSTGTLLSLVAFNNHPTRGGERGGLLQNSSSSSSFSASLARKSTWCSSKKLDPPERIIHWYEGMSSSDAHRRPRPHRKTRNQRAFFHNKKEVTINERRKEGK